MKKICTTLCMTALVLALLPSQGNTQVIKLIPQPDFEPGWQWDFEPEVYKPDNLFEYIDGEAELYNDYHFKEMVTGSYVRKDNESLTFTVDIYDMGTPLNAFGIYSSFRRPELTFAKIGEEAIVSDLNIRFYKGQYYVQLTAGSTDDLVKNTIKKLSAVIANKLPAAPRPAELDLLPAEDQIPHSLKYLTKGFMGQSLFKESFQALYQLPSGKVTGFVIVFQDQAKARAALKELENSLMDRGTIKTSLKDTDSQRLLANEKYMGNILAEQAGRYIVGVQGFEDENEANGLVEKITASIKRLGKDKV